MRNVRTTLMSLALVAVIVPVSAAQSRGGSGGRDGQPQREQPQREQPSQERQQNERKQNDRKQNERQQNQRQQNERQQDAGASRERAANQQQAEQDAQAARQRAANQQQAEQDAQAARQRAANQQQSQQDAEAARRRAANQQGGGDPRRGADSGADPRRGANNGGDPRRAAGNGADPRRQAARERAADHARRRAGLSDMSPMERRRFAEESRRDAEDVRERARRAAADNGGRYGEGDLMRRLASEEAIHRSRSARLARLRQLAEERGDNDRVSAIRQLEATERGRFERLQASGRQRAGATDFDRVRSDLRARLNQRAAATRR